MVLFLSFAFFLTLGLAGVRALFLAQELPEEEDVG